MKSTMNMLKIAAPVLLAASAVQAGMDPEVRSLAELVKNKAESRAYSNEAQDSWPTGCGGPAACKQYRIYDVGVNRPALRDTSIIYTDCTPFGVGEEDELDIQRTYSFEKAYSFGKKYSFGKERFSCPDEKVSHVQLTDQGLDGLNGSGDTYRRTQCTTVKEWFGSPVVKPANSDGTDSVEPSSVYRNLVKESVLALQGER
ncbi:MAG: hypothetical protein AABX70_07110 [Nanoarchaeota archaeon]